MTVASSDGVPEGRKATVTVPRPEALDEAERARLDVLEATVTAGLSSFVAVGSALTEIRDSRLYRESHGTFESYCEDRWNLAHSHSYRLIEAAAVVGALSPIGDAPANEAQARELAPLRDRPEEMAAAWEEARQSADADGRSVTAVDVRTAVSPRLGVHYSSATPEWATPQALFDRLNGEFAFELDVCATEENAKCARYFTEADDGLSQEWRGTCWMNPPYGDEIPKWIKKAHDSALDGATVVCLVPARVDTGWWWDYCRYGEIRFIRGRLRFGDATASAPFPSAVVVFGRRPNLPESAWWPTA